MSMFIGIGRHEHFEFLCKVVIIDEVGTDLLTESILDGRKILVRLLHIHHKLVCAFNCILHAQGFECDTRLLQTLAIMESHHCLFVT